MELGGLTTSWLRKCLRLYSTSYPEPPIGGAGWYHDCVHTDDNLCSNETNTIILMIITKRESISSLLPHEQWHNDKNSLILIIPRCVHKSQQWIAKVKTWMIIAFNHSSSAVLWPTIVFVLFHSNDYNGTPGNQATYFALCVKSIWDTDNCYAHKKSWYTRAGINFNWTRQKSKHVCIDN
jgi:hypothetical protein